MAVSTHKTGTTIRGIYYNVGDGFTVQSAVKGSSDSEGSGSAQAFSVGDTAYYRGYATDKDSGKLTSYPYMIYVNSSTMRGWFQETIFPYASYTVSYNANGGSGAPSNQTKRYGQRLWLNTTKPTREGYTFLYWLEPTRGVKFYPDNSSDFYTDYNGGQTLVAQWQENKLTINYYSNYATSVSDGALNSVDSSANVLVKTQNFLYSGDYSEYGLTNYTSTSNSFWLKRIGYTGTGDWGTKTSGGVLVNQSTGFTTGQSLAEAFEKSLKTGNASVDVYAQWRENKLTVTYYSNYADTLTPNSNITPLNEVDSTKNVAIYQYDFKYATEYSNGLHNYSMPNSNLYMTRTRYSATGYWCTTTAEDFKIEGDKTNSIVDDSVIAIGENMGFDSGQALATMFGLSLENGDKSISLYAHWNLLASRIAVYLEDGKMVKGLLHIYDENGDDHYGIMTIYDDQGNAREVV